MDDASGGAWTTTKWLQSTGVLELLSEVINANCDSDELQRVCSLGRSGSDTIRQLFNDKGVLGQLASLIAHHASALEGSLMDASANSGGKFQADSGGFQLSYGSLTTFYEGLEGLIGRPTPSLWIEMTREHSLSADSSITFKTGNYGIETTSEIEWLFVISPDTGLEQLSLNTWPAENPSMCSRPRQPRSLAAFDSEVRELNERLKQESCPALMREELVAARLYTGPMVRALAPSVPMYPALMNTPWHRSSKSTMASCEHALAYRFWSTGVKRSHMAIRIRRRSMQSTAPSSSWAS